MNASDPAVQNVPQDQFGMIIHELALQRGDSI